MACRVAFSTLARHVTGPWPLPVRIGYGHHSPSPSPVLFSAVIHETEASERDLSSTNPEKERPGRDLSSTNRETVTTKDDLLSTNRLRDAPLCYFRRKIAQGSLPDAICRRQIAPRSDLGLIIVRQSSRRATRARWASEDSVRVARGRRDRGKTLPRLCREISACAQFVTREGEVS